MSITNFEIEEICKSANLPLVSVCSKDQLPSRRIVGSYYINLQNSDEGSGTHWVFARIFECSKAIYFDSFGIAMPTEVEEFLKPFKPIPYSNRQIQDIKSELCGRFCLLCDYFFSHQLPSPLPTSIKHKNTCSVDNYFHEFLNSWSDDTIKNNQICKERFKKL
jgi:hypothetical protein